MTSTKTVGALGRDSTHSAHMSGPTSPAIPQYRRISALGQIQHGSVDADMLLLLLLLHENGRRSVTLPASHRFHSNEGWGSVCCKSHAASMEPCTQARCKRAAFQGQKGGQAAYRDCHG
ncbi:hypothetical protein LY76DRAFT_597143 [Colletotrichum caudatum]|nr:hypothetical protein LY76DRAFT_597143 [Colletotrichum caudatum]